MDKILLSFDLEEFDIPEEYGQKLNDEEKISVTLQGLLPLLELLEKHNIVATFYTTAFFAQANPGLITEIVSKHEIASHGFYHSSFKNEDILASKEVLEKIIGISIEGYRMARLKSFDKSLLKKAGYAYDSSLNPTFIPGRYNNFFAFRTPFISEGIVYLPASVATVFRIPLFWISFKTFPFSVYTSMAVRTLHKYGYLNLYFHPWEFADISRYKLPAYIKRTCGKELLVKFDRLLSALGKHGEFMSSANYRNQFLNTGVK